MPTKFNDLVEKVKSYTKFQQVPVPFTDEEYGNFVVDGIRGLYVDTGNSSGFDKDFDVETRTFKTTLTTAEYEYVVNGALMGFYSLVQQDVNRLVGYSTDSLSITHADKPYENISSEVERLKERQIEVFFVIESERVG